MWMICNHALPIKQKKVYLLFGDKKVRSAEGNDEEGDHDKIRQS